MAPETLSSEQPHSNRQPNKTSAPAWIIPAFVAVVLVVMIGLTLLVMRLAQTIPVTLVVNGEAREIQTHAGNVAQLLQESEVVIDNGDRISVALDTPLSDAMIVRVDRARSVFLTVDGTTTPLWTAQVSPADILGSAGVHVGAGDRIVIDGTEADNALLDQWSVPITSIDVRHAVMLRTHDGDDIKTVQTTGATVGEALFAAGITLYLTDTISLDLNMPLTRDVDVTITRAHPVEIIADGETIRTRSQGETVAAALADANVALVGLDYAIPAEATPLRPGMSIRVIRVHEEIDAEQASLPFETVYQADSMLELDQRQTTQGQEGIQETRTRVRYENGIAVKRTQEDTVIVQPPVNRVISYGTNVVIRTIDTPDGPREYWRKLRMYMTSYHPAALGGDDVTATGCKLEHGVVGSDPDILPYGTEIYVRNYGVGVVADTGGKRSMPLWVDLGYSDADYRGWSGYADVYILTPVPDQIDYFLPTS